ncbi:SusC/RagA family TonB-linked outer membrane protein [Niabella ginsenosidivorans]|uniref:SusC/RagA family TonB-linked outer membrane protein n=1 Tax=Niabella ginsenosidivorans TaxID=1176587 RepID=A0A1A9I6G7_9BACT|nr:TonB-dependent receptor [Niabella ginsenosidivorans]ANH82925.1 SusC/RagA family TonB-linked outer membrane protein [Niabella ginsenosidivorans]
MKRTRASVLLLLLFCFGFAMNGFSQGKMITGTVIDDKGNPVANVSVIVKGSTSGTSTNEEGKFTIAAKQGDVLELTSVGFKATTFKVGAEQDVSITLVSDVSNLTDVVVIGYGTARKKDLTGSVAVVDMKELKSQPAASPVEALQGKAAGVQIINDGSPGSTPQIRIRGFSTINNNDPLFIIDGMPYEGKLAWLSPNDIESMQVLKDASASSIYGARANNGVVIITTKKGRKGPPKVSLDAYYGVQSPNRETFPKYLNPMQFAEYLYTAFKNAGLTPGTTTTTGSNYGNDPDKPTLPEYLLAGSATGQNITAADADPSKYRYTQDASTFYQITKANQAGTNWMKEITHNAPMQNYQLTVLGGGENSSYAVSGGYLNQDGTIKYTGFKRYTIRANTNFTTLGGRLNIGESMQYSRDEGQGFATNVNTAGQYMGEGSPIGWTYRMQTIIPVYDIMGNFAGSKGSLLGNAENPLASLYRAKDNIWTDNQFFGTAFADLKIIEGLNLKTTYGILYNNYQGKNISYPNPEFSEGSYSNNPMSEGQGYQSNWTWTNTLTYKHRFNDKHDLTLMVGTEAVKEQSRVLSGSGNGFFVFGDLNYYYVGAASTNVSATSSGGFSTLFSTFGRADYAFKDKYLLSATFRRDGSSKFGPSHQYGNFPAGSAAWRVSNEEFMKSVSWINDLKLRAGYGETGNQSIPDFQYLRQFQSVINNSSYPINGTALSSGIWTNSYDNPDIKWEALKSWNAGFDFTVLNNKLDGTFDVYNRKTTDMLYRVPLPAQAAGGGLSPWVNVGSMSNKGFEFALNYHYINSVEDGFKFDAGVNFSRNINKVLELAPTVTNQVYGGFRSISTSILMPGQPLGAFYGYKVTGIYQSQQDIDNTPHYEGARVGGLKYADVSGADGKPDGIVDAFDRTIIGNPHPKFLYSLSFNASYKRFDLLMFFNGSYGNEIFDATRYYTDFSAFDGAVSTRMLDAWSPTNTGSMIPSPYRNPSAYELAANSYYIQPGSYFRMKNLQIGYNFKMNGNLKDKISALRVYISGTNLFTITKYSGLDPEITQFSSTFTAPGVDLGTYPASRQFLLGLNVTF